MKARPSPALPESRSMRAALAALVSSVALAALASSTALAAIAPDAPAAPVAGPGTSGDAAAGAAIYTRCEACHALAYDRTGPHHCGLIGRKAGSVSGFAYSDAMKRSGIVWNAATLDRFLADPLHVVPGTTMGYAGVADARERADLIAFLRAQSDGPMCTKR